MSYLVLIVSVLAYATGIVAQSVAARQTERREGADPGLLVRLARDRVYLLGFCAQVVGFGLAFLARAELPLFLVQAASTSAAGVATLAGFLILGWRLRAAELAALGVLAVGLVLLVAAAQPSVAKDLPPTVAFILVGVLVLTAVAAFPAGRVGGARGAVLHGMLAGVAFAVLAIASRPLAAGPLLEIPLKPLFWLVVAAALVGQTLFAGALQRGSSTAAAASMDAVTTVFSSIVGLVVLGDSIVAGYTAWVAVGLALVVLAVIGFGIFGNQQDADPARALVRRLRVGGARRA
jgi:drug/metabolite transporter (DMT)-like permease